MSVSGFTSAIKRGATAVRSAYTQQKKAAEARSRRRMRVAKTKLERERIKAELELEKLRLQKAMYEARAKVEREKEAVAKAKRASGGSGFGKFMSDTGKSFRKMQSAYYGAAPKRRKTVAKKRTAAKRVVRG